MGSNPSKKKDDFIILREDGVRRKHVEISFEDKEVSSVFNIPFEELEIMEEKPEGFFVGHTRAKILLAKYKGKDVILRMVSEKEFSKGDWEDFKVDTKLREKIQAGKHPNLIKYLGCTLSLGTDINVIYGVVFECCAHGNVKHYIETGNKLSLVQKIRILFYLSQGLNYLSKNEIIIKDPRSEIIYLDENLNPKIFCYNEDMFFDDFGMFPYGTSQYMSPEKTLSNNYGTPAIVYAFSIIMYEILFEDFYPYGKSPEFNVELKAALNEDFRPQIDKKMEEIKDEEIKKKMEWMIRLMKKCWDNNPEERLTFDEISKIIKENVVSSGIDDPYVMKDVFERIEFLKDERDVIFENCEFVSNIFIDVKISGISVFEKLPKMLFL